MSAPAVPRQPATEPDLDDPRAAAVATRIDERLERLELGLAGRLDRLEEQADAHDAGLEVRLEKLQAQLEISRHASVEAVGMLAGRLVASLEEQVAGIDLALQARHEDLLAHLTAAVGERHDEMARTIEGMHDATLQAIRRLASGDLVDRLLDGVVALGEVLDADLVHLRPLIVAGGVRPAVGTELDESGADGDPDEPDPDG